MYWKRKKTDYDILISPINKPINQLSAIEAQEYFDWFIGCIPQRIEYLQKYTNVNLCSSPESLVPLWDWFLEHARIEKTPKIKLEEIKKQLSNEPPEITKRIIEENSYQFSLETEYMMIDIAMYFGEVCVSNNQTIFWGFHTDTKKDSFANRPLLMGFLDNDFVPPFHAEFDPVFTVRCIAFSMVEGVATKNDLIHMYEKWKRLM